jgi:DNA-directed RNA polymerase subunit RPC12/RpoP
MAPTKTTARARCRACLQLRVIRVDDLCRRCHREGYGPHMTVKPKPVGTLYCLECGKQFDPTGSGPPTCPRCDSLKIITSERAHARLDRPQARP